MVPVVTSSSNSEQTEKVDGGQDHRLCRLRYRILYYPSSDTASPPETFSSRSNKASPNNDQPSYTLLQIQTNQGARHMIRALLACHGCPIAGDLRYGASQPLPDRSVALHASRLQLNNDVIKIPNLHQTSFSAPIPTNWKDYFGFPQHILSKFDES